MHRPVVGVKVHSDNVVDHGSPKKSVRIAIAFVPYGIVTRCAVLTLGKRPELASRLWCCLLPVDEVLVALPRLRNSSLSLDVSILLANLDLDSPMLRIIDG